MSQLALYDGVSQRPLQPRSVTRLCVGCRAKEARYGFRDETHQSDHARPRTLCFECFRMELTRRHALTARRAGGWRGTQVALPLGGSRTVVADLLESAARRRRQAQIAARHALGW
jgi:hypothetical protein